MIKNNGYGLGLREVARALEPDERVSAFGVVKVAEALALREAGIRKPVLLLAVFDDTEGEDLVRQEITLSLCVPDIGARVARATARAGRPARGQFYVDTGMSRMGLPWHSALPVLRELARSAGLVITGMLTELTEDREFDSEQVRRLASLAAEVSAAGITRLLHAASSHACSTIRHLADAVTGDLTVWRLSTDDGREHRSPSSLWRLTQGAWPWWSGCVRDTVSYGRRFKAERLPIATVPAAADGYPTRKGGS